MPFFSIFKLRDQVHIKISEFPFNFIQTYLIGCILRVPVSSGVRYGSHSYVLFCWFKTVSLKIKRINIC